MSEEEATPQSNVIGLQETLTVRLPRHLMAYLKEESTRSGKSINAVIVELVQFDYKATATPVLSF